MSHLPPGSQQRPASQPGQPATAYHQQLQQQTVVSLPPLPLSGFSGSTLSASSFSLASSHPLAPSSGQLLPMQQPLLYHHSQQPLQPMSSMQPFQSMQQLNMPLFTPSNVTQSAPITYGGVGQQQLVMPTQYMYSQYSAPLPQQQMQRPMMHHMTATPATSYSTASTHATSTTAAAMSNPMPVVLTPNPSTAINPYSLLPGPSSTTRTTATMAAVSAAAAAADQFKQPRSKDKIKHSKSETRRRTRLRVQFDKLREVTRTDKKDRYSILQAAMDRIVDLEGRLDEKDRSRQEGVEGGSGASRKRRDKKRHRGRGEGQQDEQQEEETEEAVMKREEDDQRVEEMEREERESGVAESSPAIMSPPSSSPFTTVSTSLLNTLPSVATTSSSPTSPGLSSSTCSSPVWSYIGSPPLTSPSPPSMQQGPI